MSDEIDADISSSSAMVSRLNTALTSSIMEFILHDDTVDIDVLRRSLHYQVTVDIVTLSVCLSVFVTVTAVEDSDANKSVLTKAKAETFWDSFVSFY